MPTPTRRRWFQFGLRAMFAVVTVFAVVVAYEANQIRQRRIAKAVLLDHDAEVFVKTTELLSFRVSPEMNSNPNSTGRNFLPSEAFGR